MRGPGKAFTTIDQVNVAEVVGASGDGHAVRAVAVIGASRYLGAHLVGALLREPGIEKVVAIDSRKPSAQFRRRMGEAEFLRVDPQSPRMQGLLREAGVDTVVHVGLDNNDFAPGGRAAVKESNIMGSMHVMAAVGRADEVKRFVLLSSTSVYGSSGMDPARFSEDMAARRNPGSGIPRDYLSVEGYARGLNRKRPDIEVTILRIPAIIGLPEPTVFGELIQPSLSPVLAGYDPRIQLLHPQDALEALVLATRRGPGGTFNIAGDGMVTLCQAIRRAGHIPVPVLAPLFRVASGFFTGDGLRRIGSAQLQYLRHGRGVDTRRMREVFGFEPKYTTDEALAAFIKDGGIEPIVSVKSARAAVRAATVALPRVLHPAVFEGVDRVLAELAESDTAGREPAKVEPGKVESGKVEPPKAEAAVAGGAERNGAAARRGGAGSAASPAKPTAAATPQAVKPAARTGGSGSGRGNARSAVTAGAKPAAARTGQGGAAAGTKWPAPNRNPAKAAATRGAQTAGAKTAGAKPTATTRTAGTTAASRSNDIEEA